MKHLQEALTMLAGVKTPWFKKLVAQVVEAADLVVAKLVADFGITPLIIGGLAVQRYGYSRFTEDVDILVSANDFGVLIAANLVTGRTLLVGDNVRVEVLVEGELGLPNPETIRDGNSFYPTLEGLVLLKMLSGRVKDEADIIELLKINTDSNLTAKAKALLSESMFQDFLQLYEIAKHESSKK